MQETPEQKTTVEELAGTERSQEKKDLIRLWVQDVCYPPELLVWGHTEWRGWDWLTSPEQPDWRQLSFQDWLQYEKLPDPYEADADGGELALLRPDFQGWAVNVFKVEYAGECMVYQCTKPAVTQIAWNCHGTCCEAFVCQDHVSRHGCWADSL